METHFPKPQLFQLRTKRQKVGFIELKHLYNIYIYTDLIYTY